MKKIIIYIISFIFICFIIPALLTKRTIPANSEEKENISQGNEQETNKNQETEIEKTNYNYNQYGTIALLHKKTGEIEQVNLDDYLCNVVSAEMPASY